MTIRRVFVCLLGVFGLLACSGYPQKDVIRNAVVFPLHFNQSITQFSGSIRIYFVDSYTYKKTRNYPFKSRWAHDLPIHYGDLYATAENLPDGLWYLAGYDLFEDEQQIQWSVFRNASDLADGLICVRNGEVTIAKGTLVMITSGFAKYVENTSMPLSESAEQAITEGLADPKYVGLAVKQPEDCRPSL